MIEIIIHHRDRNWTSFIVRDKYCPCRPCFEPVNSRPVSTRVFPYGDGRIRRKVRHRKCRRGESNCPSVRESAPVHFSSISTWLKVVVGRELRCYECGNMVIYSGNNFKLPNINLWGELQDV